MTIGGIPNLFQTLWAGSLYLSQAPAQASFVDYCVHRYQVRSINFACAWRGIPRSGTILNSNKEAATNHSYRCNFLLTFVMVIKIYVFFIFFNREKSNGMARLIG